MANIKTSLFLTLFLLRKRFILYMFPFQNEVYLLQVRSSNRAGQKPRAKDSPNGVLIPIYFDKYPKIPQFLEVTYKYIYH